MMTTARISTAAAFAIAAFVAFNPVASLAKETPVERANRLDATADRYWDEMLTLGGGRTPGESINNVKTRMREISDIVDRLDAAAIRAGATVEELEATRKNFDDASIFKPSDIPIKGGAKLGTTALKQGLSQRAGASLGVAGWVLLGADYAGRKVIKEINVSALEDLVRQSQAQLTDMYRLITTLRQEWNNELDKLKRLQSLKVRYDRAYAAAAEASERLRPATSRANIRRVDDAEGDREEERLVEVERRRRGRARMVIERADGEVPMPPRRMGVHLSDEHPATHRRNTHRRDTHRHDSAPRHRRTGERSRTKRHDATDSHPRRVRTTKRHRAPDARSHKIRRETSHRRVNTRHPHAKRVAAPRFRTNGPVRVRDARGRMRRAGGHFAPSPRRMSAGGRSMHRGGARMRVGRRF